MTPEGAAKIAARRIGVEVAEYLARREAGEKWCFGCRDWHSVTAFSVDRSRSDGLNGQCREAASAYIRSYLRSSACSACGAACYNNLCADCYAARAEHRRREREAIAPYKRLARAIVIAARLRVKWAKRAKRLLLGIARVAERVLRAEMCERGKAQRLAERERGKALKRARWWSDSRRGPANPISLDAPIRLGVDGGDLSFYEIARTRSLAHITDDPADLSVRDEDAALLRSLVGAMEPEDVQRMTAWDLDRLRDRLVEAGLAPGGVHQEERERLRDPQRHAGASITKSGRRGGGKRTRAQQQQVTRDHKVRELTTAQKHAHAERRSARRSGLATRSQESSTREAPVTHEPTETGGNPHG